MQVILKCFKHLIRHFWGRVFLCINHFMHYTLCIAGEQLHSVTIIDHELMNAFFGLHVYTLYCYYFLLSKRGTNAVSLQNTFTAG